MNTIMECSRVNKRYGKTEAIRDLDLKLEEHTIYGLLGRNGAGKTTLLNLITGSIFPDDGHIAIAGLPLRRGEMPQNVCYVREKTALFGGAKVMEALELASAFHPHWDWTLAYELIRSFKLNPNQKIRQLSRGMESLVGNIVGLASRAPLTIYDEPVLGLDALMRERFYRLLVEDYAMHPRTILLSTHMVDEIAMVAERICVMEAGSILLHDDVDRIRTQSHLLKGNKEAVRHFTEGRQILYEEHYGNGVLAAVYGLIGEEEKAEAARGGISIVGLPLQKFFAYLIEEGGYDG